MKKQQEEVAIVKTGSYAMELPAHIKVGDDRGMENVAQTDLNVPRLAVAQSQSPQLVENNSKFIAGLKAGDIFNTLTGQIYGRAGIKVVVVRHEAAHFIEFDPDNLGEVLDFNVPPTDPRTEFTIVGGKTIKPRATKFLESLAYILPAREAIALSFKGSGLKVGKHLRDLPHGLKVASFALVFELSSAFKSEGSLNWYEFEARCVGSADADTYAAAADFYRKIKDLGLKTDVDVPTAPADKDVPF